MPDKQDYTEKHQVFYIDSVKSKEIEVDGQTKTVYPFVLTSEIVDRDGDVVVINDLNIDNYKKNPVVFFEHDTRQNAVGNAYNIKKLKDKVTADVWFHELDEESKQIKRYVDAGVYRSGSIGFRVYGSRKRRAERDEKTPFETVNELMPTELYEFSVVKIPANPDAIMKAHERELEAKQKGLLKDTDNIMEFKAGAVLNQKNKQNLLDAKEKIENVLLSADNEKIEEVEAVIEEIKRITLQEYNKQNTKRITIKEYNQLLNKEGRDAR
jgi:phage head maturation protease